MDTEPPCVSMRADAKIFAIKMTGSAFGRLPHRRLVPSEIERLRRERRRRSAGLDGIHDVQQQVLLRLEKLLAVGGQDVGGNLEIERRWAKADQADAGGGRLDSG